MTEKQMGNLRRRAVRMCRDYRITADNAAEEVCQRAGITDRRTVMEFRRRVSGWIACNLQEFYSRPRRKPEKPVDDFDVELVLERLRVKPPRNGRNGVVTQ